MTGNEQSYEMYTKDMMDQENTISNTTTISIRQRRRNSISKLCYWMMLVVALLLLDVGMGVGGASTSVVPAAAVAAAATAAAKSEILLERQQHQHQEDGIIESFANTPRTTDTTTTTTATSSSMSTTSTSTGNADGDTMEKKKRVMKSMMMIMDNKELALSSSSYSHPRRSEEEENDNISSTNTLPPQQEKHHQDDRTGSLTPDSSKKNGPNALLSVNNNNKDKEGRGDSASAGTAAAATTTISTKTTITAGRKNEMDDDVMVDEDTIVFSSMSPAVLKETSTPNANNIAALRGTKPTKVLLEKQHQKGEADREVEDEEAVVLLLMEEEIEEESEKEEMDIIFGKVVVVDEDENITSQEPPSFHPVTTMTSHRILQQSISTTTTNVTNPRCSNITDSFRTSLVFAYEGNKTLITDDQLVLLGNTFGTTYNTLTSTTTSNISNALCDPFFRTIATVKASTNLSFTGAKEGQLVTNPLPMVPVRRQLLEDDDRSRLTHPMQKEHLRDDSSSSTSSSSLWESLVVQSRRLVHDDRNHKEDTLSSQRRLQQEQGGGGGGVNFGNVTIDIPESRFDVGYILFEVVGNCRACEGNRPGFSLFDDTSSRRRHRRRQKRQRNRNRRELQVENDIAEDCTCPVVDIVANGQSDGRFLQQEKQIPTPSVALNADIFQSILIENIQVLQENGDLDFLEEVNEIFDVAETECPTKEDEFSTVHLVTGMVFDSDLLLSLGSVGVQRVEKLFRDSYNGIARQLCDPLFRSISRAQFVSIFDEPHKETVVGDATLATFEFVVEATCRGEDCTDPGCLFDDIDDTDGCGSAPPPGRQRQRKRRRTIESDVFQRLTKNKEEDTSDMPFLHHTSQPDDVRWLIDVDVDQQVGSSERCFCRKGRSNRPATLLEFKTAFQRGLDQITQESKLKSCQACEFASECQSDVCLEGQCAEKDTGLLSNGCECNLDSLCQTEFCQGTTTASGTNETETTVTPTLGVCSYKLEHCQECVSDSNCISGFCVGGRCGDDISGLLEIGCPCQGNGNCGTQRCDVLGTGTCQPKLESCGVCNYSTDCISNQCTGGVCGDLVDGKIPTGCNCRSNNQCQSNRCARDVGVAGQCVGKIIDTCTEPCLVSGDCESGKCGSIVCLPADSTLLADGCLATSGSECQSSRSIDNVCVPLSGLCEVCEVGADCTTGRCTSGHCADSLGKLPNDCGCLVDLDCASGSCQNLVCGAPPAVNDCLDTTLNNCDPDATCFNNVDEGGLTCECNEGFEGDGFTCSLIPSTNPTSQPSDIPTRKLTSAPSSTPSSEPSSKPSSEPSSNPTGKPSLAPTAMPSWEPSAEPSMRPSRAATPQPSDRPSNAPTTQPSISPSIAPTGGPTLYPTTSQPSLRPSNSPSGSPTCNPGFEGDGVSCLNIDECSNPDLNSCDPNAECLDSDGSYSCACYDGFDGDGFTCTPQECFINTGTFDFLALYAFCEALPDGEKCCTDEVGEVGPGACSDWDLNSEYKICRKTCKGEDACKTFSGDAELEYGSCIEKDACFELGSPITISSNSCVGFRACWRVGFDISGTITVGSSSCTDERACQGAGRYAQGSLTIGDSACGEYVSCSNTGRYVSDGDITIGAGSCATINGCSHLGETSTSVSIGTGACTANSACQDLGNSTLGSVTISDYSCTSGKACFRVGQTASSIFIGTYSCITSTSTGRSCYYLGRSVSEGIVSIGNNACTEGTSCRQVGEFAASVTIGNSACSGRNACQDLGNLASSVSIGTSSCNDDGANENMGVCQALGEAATGIVEVGDASCVGRTSCYWVGRDDASSVTIQGSSCLGNTCCSNLGYFASSVSIGGSSCTFDYSCSLLGTSAIGAIEVGGAACKEDSSCFQLGHSSSSFVTVEAGACEKTKACTNLGYNAISIHVRGGTCINNQACESLGEFSIEGSIDIGPTSCFESTSCFSAGQNVIGSIAIGESSCLGTNSCREAGQPLLNVLQQASSSLDIGTEACEGDEACRNCFDQDDTPVVIDDSAFECPYIP